MGGSGKGLEREEERGGHSGRLRTARRAQQLRNGSSILTTIDSILMTVDAEWGAIDTARAANSALIAGGPRAESEARRTSRRQPDAGSRSVPPRASAPSLASWQRAQGPALARGWSPNPSIPAVKRARDSTCARGLVNRRTVLRDPRTLFREPRAALPERRIVLREARAGALAPADSGRRYTRPWVASLPARVIAAQHRRWMKRADR